MDASKPIVINVVAKNGATRLVVTAPSNDRVCLESDDIKLCFHVEVEALTENGKKIAERLRENLVKEALAEFKMLLLAIQNMDTATKNTEGKLYI